MKRIKIEWRKLRVFRRLDELEAAVERIERHVGMREPAVMGVDVPSREKIGGGESAPNQSPTAGGEKAPTAEEIMMMWRYTADEIADMNRPVGGGSR